MAPVPPRFLREVLLRTAVVPEVAARLPASKTAVAIRLTDDAEMANLNRTYADKPNATDVLSFTGVGDHLGDIAISWAATQRQAARYKQEPKTELALLSVHGFLHLLGWDHAVARERKEMNRLTVEALRRSRITLAPRRL